LSNNRNTNEKLNISSTDISDYPDPTDAIYNTFISTVIPRDQYSNYSIYNNAPIISSKSNDSINQVNKEAYLIYGG